VLLAELVVLSLFVLLRLMLTRMPAFWMASTEVGISLISDAALIAASAVRRALPVSLAASAMLATVRTASSSGALTVPPMAVLL
jgi:hypothetical protein